MKHFLLLFLAALCCHCIQARPVLQPEVKEYHPIQGAFSIAGMPVFYQDQRQCEIGAGEIPGTGKKIKGFSDTSLKGIYIAVASSPEGKMLIKEFSLDVPAKKQGYTIKAAGSKVAIVGFDNIGTLYGAVTFRQMATDQTVESAIVRDYPDLLFRGAMSYSRGMARWNYGERDLAGFKAAVDELLRHKINIISDFKRSSQILSDAEIKQISEICRYAEERGFWICMWPSTQLYNQADKPAGTTLKNWHCVADGRPSRRVESYYCWSDDAATATQAEKTAAYLKKFGVSKLLLIIHPVDGGSEKDPEHWSRRCKKCRRKYKDPERWKAGIVQFNIQNDTFRKHFPEAVIGSCIYPYHADMLAVPESRRDAVFKQNVTEYWKNISDGIADKNFFFNIWMPGRSIMKEYREIIGKERKLNYTDHYCLTAGIFATYHRYAGSLYDENIDNIFLSVAQDTFGQWESIFLAGEHAWDRNAPGSEIYIGGAFYDGLKDHTGPAVIMEKTLPRICYTFWGKELAPYMTRVMASGIMPRYIENPASAVAYWNKVRRDPMYDPNVKKDTLVQGSLPPVEDSPELMYRQVTAGQLVCEQLALARKHLDKLTPYQRKYFINFARLAPFWLAAARTQYNIRIAGELIAAGKNEAALKILENAQRELDADFDRAEKNLESLRHEKGTSSRLGWSLDRKVMQKQLDDAKASARVLLQPRRIGRFIKVGITRGDSAEGIKKFLDNFANVRTTVIDNISLVELDKYDCVIITAGNYKKAEFFQNIPAYVRKGGGGVILEGTVCGHERFDTKTPFPEIVKTSPARVDNFRRELKKIDGTLVKSMYVDYFELVPGKAGEVTVTAPDGKPVVVRGRAGAGKVVFCGTVNLEGVNNTFVTAKTELFGINAQIVQEAIEYFTNVRLRKKTK
ncbi:MAG: hypothetical protein E7058_10535 [Lentisphaerae bacterium]|nr:hypothetical protein [Lentisphaerota bacterium]